jgi:hypothetical protein
LTAAGPAAASSPYQREAYLLAGLIRSDARKDAGPGGGKLVGTHTCCGTRIIDVYYKARPRVIAPAPGTNPLAPPTIKESTEGAYHLRLEETVHGKPMSVSLREFGTEPGYALGTEPEDHASALSYDIQIGWLSSLPDGLPGGGKAGWSARVSYSYLTVGVEALGASTAQLGQATEVAEKAARQAPVEGETDLLR